MSTTTTTETPDKRPHVVTVRSVTKPDTFGYHAKHCSAVCDLVSAAVDQLEMESMMAEGDRQHAIRLLNEVHRLAWKPIGAKVDADLAYLKERGLI